MVIFTFHKDSLLFFNVDYVFAWRNHSKDFNESDKQNLFIEKLSIGLAKISYENK